MRRRVFDAFVLVLVFAVAYMSGFVASLVIIGKLNEVLPAAVVRMYWLVPWGVALAMTVWVYRSRSRMHSSRARGDDPHLQSTYPVLIIIFLMSVVGPLTVPPMLPSRLARGLGQIEKSFGHDAFTAIMLASLLIFGTATTLLVKRYLGKKMSVLNPQLCPKCGYSLIGLTENRCPECGEAFPKEWLVDLDVSK